MSEEFPVYVEVTRASGGTEKVRVGSAVKSGDGFVLRLGELHMAGAPVAAQSRAASPAPSFDAGGGPVFPNYGRSKNMPIAGASETDLEYYAAGCRRTLSDDTKSRWHEKERVLLAAIEAELVRQRGGSPSSSSSSSSSNPFDDRAPPPSDDDIPF